MEARKYEPGDYGSPPSDEIRTGTGGGPTWRRLVDLVHPLVWAWIAALWLGLAWLILSEMV